MTLSLIKSGQGCKVFFRSQPDANVAILPAENSLGLAGDSFVVIEVNRKVYHCRVELLKSAVTDKAYQDNIQLSDQIQSSNSQFDGTYWKGSELGYKLHLAFHSKKSRLSFAATLVALGGAVVTALRASPGASTENSSHFHAITWILFACTAAGACVSWYKDNLG